MTVNMDKRKGKRLSAVSKSVTGSLRPRIYLAFRLPAYSKTDFFVFAVSTVRQFGFSPRTKHLKTLI